ncbi:MAG: BrnT family toxin [Spirochaetales bacterium]|nr:BrnT family toxin [Spirochaetales bacterium]
MKFINFSWDDFKNRSNIIKHGISFDEAKTAFYDDSAIDFYDNEHSESEERFLLLGMSYKPRLLVVCYSIKNDHSVIRIISARKATRNESKYYTGG